MNTVIVSLSINGTDLMIVMKKLKIWFNLKMKRAIDRYTQREESEVARFLKWRIEQRGAAIAPVVMCRLTCALVLMAVPKLP